MERFLVKFKNFRSREWYTALTADNIEVVYSAAECRGHGRSYKIIDTENGVVLKRKGHKRYDRKNQVDYYWLLNRHKLEADYLKSTEMNGDSTTAPSDKKEEDYE